MLLMNLIFFSIWNLRFIILRLFLILSWAKNCLFVKFRLVQARRSLHRRTQFKMSQIHANNALRILNQWLSSKRFPLASRTPVFLNLFYVIFNFLLLPPFLKHIQRCGDNWRNFDICVQIDGKLVGQIWNVHRGNCHYVFVSLEVFQGILM